MDETILLVEDDHSVREFAGYVLEMQGYRVLKTHNGKEALIFSQEYAGTIHLLFTDISMPPHMNGDELAREIRTQRPNIKTLYMSAGVNLPNIEIEVDERVAHFLAKPFSPSGLLKKVKELLENDYELA